MKEIGTVIKEEEKYSEIKDLTKKIDKKKYIDLLGLNSENYITFKWNNMWFIDSFKFMSSSLSNIVGALTKEDMELANKLYKLNGVKPDQIDTLSKKISSPYIWFDNYEKMKASSSSISVDAKRFPNLTHFLSSLITFKSKLPFLHPSPKIINSIKKS